MHAFRVTKYRSKKQQGRKRKVDRLKKKRLKKTRTCSTGELVKGISRVRSFLKSPECDVLKPVPLNGLRQATWRVRKTLPRDEVKRTLVLKEINRMENGQSDNPSATCVTGLTQDLLSMTKLKYTKKFHQLESVATGIKKKYKSFRAAHRSLGGLSWKRWHSICKPKKVLHIERRITQKEKDEIVDLFLSPEVSVTLPFKRYAKKKFMIMTVSDAYQKYIRMKKDQAKSLQQQGVRILSISSFYKLKPKFVKPKKSLPLNQCTCGACANFSLHRCCLISNGVKGISKKSSTAACSFLCKTMNFAEDTQFDLLTYKKECLYQECTICTPEKYEETIIESNPQLDWSKEVTWHKWMTIKKVVNNKECTGFERVPVNGSLRELVRVYAQECRNMPLHLLNSEWQRMMYCKQKSKLQPGDVQMVIDYAKNYAHVVQDEPQSAHWDRKQSTLHPIALTFPCPEYGCTETVTDEVVCITPDLNHDRFAVETFIKRTVQMLQDNKVPIKQVYEWSDNCSGQYKSRFAFELLSQSTYPRMRNFYGENHGKSAADGIIGRLKMQVDSDVKAGQIIEDAEGLYKYLESKNKTQEESSKGFCQHFRKHYFYFPSIERPDSCHEVKKLPGIKKIHSVRTTGVKGTIEVRKLTCICSGCISGSQCTNTHLVDDWKIQSFNTKVNVESISKKNHWVLDQKVKSKSSVKSGKSSRTSQKPKRDESWTDIGAKLRSCNSFSELQNVVNKIVVPTRIHSDYENFVLTNIVEDEVSMSLYPSDAPKGGKPLSVYGDGNCLTRTISVISCGNETKHEEIRARLCVEGVIHKEFYLDNDYLNLDGKFEANLAEYLAIVSEAYNKVDTSNWNRSTIERIYEQEVLSLATPGQYCSMWQVYQAANVLGRPIVSIFPEGMIEEYRSRSNRIVHPIRYYMRQLDPVCLMWTKCPASSPIPNHFVPVMKIE